MAKPQTLRDFEGTVLRRDPDGYGLVEIHKPYELDTTIASFTGEVLQNPAIEKWCKPGVKAVGRAEQRGSGYRILRIEPAPK